MRFGAFRPARLAKYRAFRVVDALLRLMGWQQFYRWRCWLEDRIWEGER